MVDLLTAKDLQSLLNVDRSTVYRMAEDGRLPAFKVGKQWRFLGSQIRTWVATAGLPSNDSNAPEAIKQGNGSLNEDGSLVSLLPLQCVQLIQDSHAELMGVMLVLTEMSGQPVTEPSNPCGLFSALSARPDALGECMRGWQEMGSDLKLEPAFQPTHLGLLCARSLIRVGVELKGMVIAGCVGAEEWPPQAADLQALAVKVGLPLQQLEPHLMDVHLLDGGQRATVLRSLQRVADIIAHIVHERQTLVGRLEAINDLTKL